MDLVAITVALAVALLASLWLWARSARVWARRLKDLDGLKRSQSTRYGQISEQFAPFMASWPWDPKEFRFIGTPVDGIQFTPDGVYIVEVKTNSSRLSPVQQLVKAHVEAGRVSWKEVRIG